MFTKDQINTAKNNDFGFKEIFVIPEKIKDAFIHDTIRKNYFSMKIIVILIFIIELFNIIRVLFFSHSGLSTLNNQIYFVMYCVLLLSAIVVTALEHIMKKHKKRLLYLYFVASFFLMIWHTLLNCYDLMGDKGSGLLVFMTASSE